MASGMPGLKAFARKLVGQYSLGADATRFSVVSFATDATTRVPWSYDAATINAGIDEMSADGATSISDGLETAAEIFKDSRPGATKILLLFVDGEQDIDAAAGQTLQGTSVAAATLIKDNDVTIFAYGFGNHVSKDTLEKIATDRSKVALETEFEEYTQSLSDIEAFCCNHSPQPPPTSPSPSPPPPSPSPPPPSPSPPPPSPSPPPPSPSPPPPSPSPPPPSPKPPCAYQVDFSLVIDESGSIKEAGPDKVKAFAKELVHMFSLGEDAARFSVVSFAANATTRVPWSYSEAEINAGIDEISPDGPTSISDGFELARELFLEGGRTGAARIVLFLSDGEQTVDAKVNTTLYQTAVDAANSVKALPATVFAWGFGPSASKATLEAIASEPSQATPSTSVLVTDVAALRGHLAGLEDAVCNESPPTSPPPPSPPPP